MKKRKDKKCYISCKGIQKINYQRALLTRYSLMFTDALEDADIFFAPIDRDGLSDRQKRDLERAETLGTARRIVLSDERLFDEMDRDPLKLEREKDEDDKRKSYEIEEDDGFELGLM